MSRRISSLNNLRVEVEVHTGGVRTHEDAYGLSAATSPASSERYRGSRGRLHSSSARLSARSRVGDGALPRSRRVAPSQRHDLIASSRTVGAIAWATNGARPRRPRNTTG